MKSCMYAWIPADGDLSTINDMGAYWSSKALKKIMRCGGSSLVADGKSLRKSSLVW